MSESWEARRDRAGLARHRGRVGRRGLPAARRPHQLLSRRVLLLFAIPGYAWLVTLAWNYAVSWFLVAPVTYIPPVVLGVLLVRAIRADRRSGRRAEPDADRPARA